MLYPKNFEQKVGFDEIRTLLKGHCISKLGAERVDSIQFMTDIEQINLAHRQVAEMQEILDTEDQLPGEDFFDMRTSIARIRVEKMYLEEQELWELKRSLDTLHSWIDLIRKDGTEEHPYPALERMSDGVFTFRTITQRIERILDKYGHLRDDASPELSRLRHELSRTEGSVSRTLHSILDSAKQEGLIDQHVQPTLRDGRLVIPVAPALKRRIRGIVHDESATGKTIFVEPSAVVEANNRIRELEAEERREIIRILQEFTNMLRPNLPELGRAYEFLADIELVLAKQRLAVQIDGTMPLVNEEPIIDWTLARHPLLDMNMRHQGKKIVPLEIKLTQSGRILIISGPNAGGKSVCLKTVGLLQYMTQCGVPVSMGENSQVGVFTDLFIDIGDEQSIDDDLSTYSSHLLNMKNMMKFCNPTSLLLIDEFGGGTEPTIGGAMAEAMLARFVERGTFGVITTHYQNLKQFAEKHDGVVNGAMLYDRQQMQALFRLEIGNPGSSFAVEIARKIGIPEDIIAAASDIVGQEYIDADKYLLDIVRDKRYWENKRQNIHQREKEMEKTIMKYEREIEDLQRQRKEIIRSAKEQAENILKESNARIENTIREIKEAQADKERTREVRQELEDFRSALDEQRKADHDEEIDRKMQKIMRRQEKKKNKTKDNRQPITDNQQPTTNNQQPTTDNQPVILTTGSTCRIKGQTSVGKIESINGKKAVVTFGVMRTTVDLERLEYATPQKQDDEPAVDYSYISRQTQEHMHKTQLNFSQEIDIRGMRGDEALQTITQYIDDATLVGAGRVRILHGTGNGILRQLIRQYLGTVPQVSSARDEHVQFGGAGITVVEFSY